MTATRAFYEGLLGLPLVGTWVETEDPATGTPSNYMHCFFELGDGSALAFFQFQEGLRPPPVGLPADPFEHHIALGVDTLAEVDDAAARLKSAGFDTLIAHHGYCYSVYTKDPNGMNVEISAYVPEAEDILAESAATADADLAAWLDGVRDGNNRWRMHSATT